MPVDSAKKQSEISKNLSLKGVGEPTVEQWEQIFDECQRNPVGAVAKHTDISHNTLNRRLQKWKANDKAKATAPLKKRPLNKKSDSRSDDENSTDDEDDDGANVTFGSSNHRALRGPANDTSTSSDSAEESPRPSKKQKKSQSKKRSRSRSPSPSPSPQKSKKSDKSSKEKKSKKRDDSSDKDLIMKKARKRMAAAFEEIPAAFNNEALQYIDQLEKQTIVEIRRAAEQFRASLKSSK